MGPPSSAANALPLHLQPPPTPTSASSAAPSIHPDCLICCTPILHHTIASCPHSLQICATCSLRLKLFVKRKKKGESSAEEEKKEAAQGGQSWECAFCKQPWAQVLFTREMRSEADHTAALALQGSDFAPFLYDASIDTHFQDVKTQSQFLKLRSIYCPLCESPPTPSPDGPAPSRGATKYFSSMVALNKHLNNAHNKHTCEACVTTRQVFIHEHEFFTQSQLLYHFQHGSPATGAHGPIDAHPFCQFCNQPFFSSDELYAHLSNQHRTCRFCQSDGSQKWYRHDVALRRHFASKHFLCDQGDCRHKPPDYAAFRDDISLRAHQLAAHVDKASLSQAQLRQMARVDLSVGFFDNRLPDGRSSSDAHSGGGRRGRRGGGEEELKSSGRDGPSYAADDDDGGAMEDYPSLQPAASAIEQRARLANDNIVERGRQEKREAQRGAGGGARGGRGGGDGGEAASSSSVSMQRSYSQPYGLAGRRFDTEDFPGLPPSSTPSPAPIAAPLPFRPTGPPAPADFPALRSITKADKKLRALKERGSGGGYDGPVPAPAQPTALQPSYGAAAMRAPPPPRSASTSPVPPAAAPAAASPYIDPRTVTHVPLPMPPPVAAEEAPVRNKALIAAIKAALSSDEFDSFRIQSSAYRAGNLTAGAYVDFFYHLMGYQEHSGEVERLLLELIALLPDEQKRKELHSAYATQMVWQKIARMKGSGGGAGKESGKAPKVKASIVSNKGGSAAIVSAPFEGVQTRPLRAGADEERREKEEREKAERELKALELQRKQEERRRMEEQAKVDKLEKLRVLREERLKAEAEDERRERERKERAERDQQREADAREEELQTQRSDRQRDDEAAVAAAAASTTRPEAGKAERLRAPAVSPPPPVRGGTMWTAARGAEEEEDEDDEELEPAFPSSTYLASATSTPLADPSLADVYAVGIEHLRGVVPAAMLHPLHFLTHLLELTHATLVHRHPPSIASPALRRFHPTDDARKRLLTLTQRLRYGQLLEFGRLAQLGVMPQSIYGLHSAVTQWRRFEQDGGGQTRVTEHVSEWMRGVLQEMKTGELVTLYEYLHRVLGEVVREEHADVQQAIERARSRGEREREAIVEEGGDRKLVLLKREEEGFGRGDKGGGKKGEAAGGGGDGGGGADGGDDGGGGKKKKGKRTLLFHGGLGLSSTLS